MKGYKVCLSYLNIKQEHILNTRKYMILLKRRICLTKKSLVTLRATLSTSQNHNTMHGHDQDIEQL